MKKCKPDKHTIGSLSWNHEYLVCDTCLECYEIDVSKWSPVTFKGPVTIIEHGKWPLYEGEGK